MSHKCLTLGTSKNIKFGEVMEGGGDLWNCPKSASKQLRAFESDENKRRIASEWNHHRGMLLLWQVLGVRKKVKVMEVMEGRRRERSPKSAPTHLQACKRDEIRAETNWKNYEEGKSDIKDQRWEWECGQAQDALGIEVTAMGSADEMENKQWSLLRWCY